MNDSNKTIEQLMEDFYSGKKMESKYIEECFGHIRKLSLTERELLDKFTWDELENLKELKGFRADLIVIDELL